MVTLGISCSKPPKSPEPGHGYFAGSVITLTFKVTNRSNIAYNPQWQVTVHEGAAWGTGTKLWDSGKVKLQAIPAGGSLEAEFKYTTTLRSNPDRDVFLNLFSADGTEPLACAEWFDAFFVVAPEYEIEFEIVGLTVS